MANINKFLEEYNKGEVKQYFDATFHASSVDFTAIIDEAHKLTLSESAKKSESFKGKNWMAETMYGNMVGYMTMYHPDLMRKDKEGRPYVQLASNIRIYLKKLDTKYRPNNVKTDHVQDLWSQNIQEEGTRIHIGYVGYMLDNEDWTNIKGIYACYTHAYYQKRIEWVLDMSAYAKGVVKMPMAAPAEDLNIIPITPKKKSNEG